MGKLIAKVRFINAVAGNVQGVRGKFLVASTILRQTLHWHPRRIQVVLNAFGRSAKVDLFGTMDEMHAIDEIFNKYEYKPKRQPEGILDLGANSGLAMVWFRLAFPNAVIHSYEPNPDVFRILMLNASRLPNVRAYNRAVGAKKGEDTFYVSRRSFASSLFKVKDSVGRKVEVDALDDAIRELRAYARVDLVKFDIEGAEFDAISASKKINDVYEILGEVHGKKAGEDPLALMDALRKDRKVQSPEGLTDKFIFRAVLKGGDK